MPFGIRYHSGILGGCRLQEEGFVFVVVVVFLSSSLPVSRKNETSGSQNTGTKGAPKHSASAAAVALAPNQDASIDVDSQEEKDEDENDSDEVDDGKVDLLERERELVVIEEQDDSAVGLNITLDENTEQPIRLPSEMTVPASKLDLLLVVDNVEMAEDMQELESGQEQEQEEDGMGWGGRAKTEAGARARRRAKAAAGHSGSVVFLCVKSCRSRSRNWSSIVSSMFLSHYSWAHYSGHSRLFFPSSSGGRHHTDRSSNTKL
jgi:hypothetical protein